jgi:hypothetical protein
MIIDIDRLEAGAARRRNANLTSPFDFVSGKRNKGPEQSGPEYRSILSDRLDQNGMDASLNSDSAL